MVRHTIEQKGGNHMEHTEKLRLVHEENILQLETMEALEVLMDTYGDEIKRLIYTYVKNDADTDDITQEVFVTIYEKLHTFQGKSTLRSWMYSIAINKSKDYLRSWNKRNQRIKEKLTLSAKNNNHVEFLEDRLIEQDEKQRLLANIMDLPLKYREVLILFYFKDFSTVEISSIIGVTEAAIRTRLKRGRDKLKQKLMERGEQHG